MSFLHALILGIVEGLTEFLPISSTFHLIFTSRLLGITPTDFTKFFEVFIQAGAILPIVVVSLKEFWKDKRLFWLTAIGFVPAAIVGLLLHKVIKGVFFESPWLMLAMFMIVGLVFLVLEWLIQQNRLKLNKKLEQISWLPAFWIGACQALAVIPGVSRAGSIMVGAMAFGMTREQAVRFSFLLAVPTILAASALDAWQTRSVLETLSVANWQALAIGFGAAFISAWLSIKWLLSFVKTHTLTGFGWYRLSLGAIIAAWLLMA